MKNKKNSDFVVFGLGKFGRSVAKTLAKHGHEVLAIDNNGEIVQEIADFVTHAVEADVTDNEALKALGIGNFDVAIVAIANNLQASIMATIMSKEFGVPYVVAKASDDLHKLVLEKVGADKIVFPEREIGVRVANSLMSNNFIDLIELSEDYSIVEIAILKDWVGKDLKELDMRAKYGLNVMAVKKEENLIITPKADKILEETDTLLVIGSNKQLKKIREMKG